MTLDLLECPETKRTNMVDSARIDD
jgi:hypothetical protein